MILELNDVTGHDRWCNCRDCEESRGNYGAYDRPDLEREQNRLAAVGLAYGESHPAGCDCYTCESVYLDWLRNLDGMTRNGARIY
jgi:hypothetical protein